ncbi:hypothetical protein FHR32_005232 [Streptosporangium album]|uniref:Uncharacterized protein n=1 Tax=Streptosporangium album TaxID=47479 RepID=A0A7W7RZ12_9ACTN|nr:hypothetical protein [Streptosporangium album]
MRTLGDEPAPGLVNKKLIRTFETTAPIGFASG